MSTLCEQNADHLCLFIPLTCTWSLVVQSCLKPLIIHSKRKLLSIELHLFAMLRHIFSFHDLFILKLSSFRNLEFQHLFSRISYTYLPRVPTVNKMSIVTSIHPYNPHLTQLIPHIPIIVPKGLSMQGVDFWWNILFYSQYHYIS